MEKKKKKSRSGYKNRMYYFWIPLGGVLGIVGGVYIVLAFAPTGYGELEGRKEESIRLINAFLNEKDGGGEGSSGIPDSSDGTSATASISPDDSGKSDAPIDWTAITKLYDQSVQRDAPINLDLAFGSVRGLSTINYTSASIGRSAYFHILDSRFEPTGDLSALCLNPVIHSDLQIAAFRILHGNEVYKMADLVYDEYDESDNSDVWTGDENNDSAPIKTPEVFRKDLSQALDRMEVLLLRDSIGKVNIEESKLGITSISIFSGIHRLSLMAITRASLNSEADKVGRMLEGYLKIVRLFHLTEFPREMRDSGGNPRSLQCAQADFYFFGEMDSFPRERLLSAVKMLEGVDPSEEQVRALRILHGNQLHDYWIKILKVYEKPPIFSITSDWWWPLDLIRRNTFDMAIRPIRKNRADLFFAETFSDEPPDPHILRIREKKFEKIAASWGNGAYLTLSSHAYNEILPALANYSNHHDRDFTRLILAASLYRSERGAFPESIAELVPEYLDASFAASPSQCWEIIMFKPRLYRGHDWDKLNYPWPDENDPLAKAWRLYDQDHNEIAKSVEALRPYARDEEEFEFFRKRVSLFEERPIFCRFSKMEEEFSFGDSEILSETQNLVPNKESILQNLKNNPSKKFNLIQVEIRVPILPMISEELLEFLDEPEAKNHP